MKITAITRLKNGTLLEALKKAGWTQLELARRIGCTRSTLNSFADLRRLPSCGLLGERIEEGQRKFLDMVQRAFGEAGVYVDVEELWPEGWPGLKESLVIEQTREVDHNLLEYREHQKLLAYGRDCYSKEELEDALEALAQVSDRERKVLELRADGKTLDEVGLRFGVTGERVRHIERTALRRVRAMMVNQQETGEPLRWVRGVRGRHEQMTRLSLEPWLSPRPGTNQTPRRNRRPRTERGRARRTGRRPNASWGVRTK